MGAPPVDAAAAGALHVLALRFENIGRDAVFDFFLGPLLQGLVAFQADAEGFELAVELKGFDDLLELLLRLVAGDEDGFDPAAGDESPLHYPGVPGQYDSPFLQRSGHHHRVVYALEENSIVAHYSQPPGELAGVSIDDEFGVRLLDCPHLLSGEWHAGQTRANQYSRLPHSGQRPALSCCSTQASMPCRFIYLKPSMI